MTDQAPHFCTHCGAPLESGAHFCSECGAALAAGAGDATTPPPAAAPAAAATPPAPQTGAGGTPPPVVPPGAPPGPDQPGGASGDGGFRVPKWAVVTLAVLVVIALIAALVWVLADGDSEAEGEIFLEPAASLGEDPFSDEVLETDPIAATSATTVPATTGDSRAVSSVQGNAPGLYGGTRDSARCDREAMIVFLEANPAKAAAWVQAINSDPTLRWSGGTQVRVGQIGDYIRELTPVTLTRDTRVTNHGFRNGRPTARQSVLQAGSAVLVDRYGVPRARCGCGNPLIPPASVRVTPTYVGPRWTGWNPVTVVVVTQVTVEIDVFILVDLLTGQRLERPAGTTGSDDIPATTTTTTTTTTVVTPPTQTQPPPQPDPAPQPVPGLGTGDVQVTLEWTGDADLDLHVIDPAGTEIYYGNQNSSSGGSLDRDKIPTCGDTGPHIENVFWPTGGAPTGQYQAFVRNLGSCSGSGSFEMVILVNGAYVGGDGGTLAANTESERVTFGF